MWPQPCIAVRAVVFLMVTRIFTAHACMGAPCFESTLKMPKSYPFLDQSSIMGRKVAMLDWSKTSLGPIETWPTSLKTTIGLILRSGFAKCLCWGPDHIAIYNDAFVPVLGEKSESLGKPFAAIWPEAWDSIGPIVARAMAGESTFIKDYPLEVTRSARGPEEAFFTFSYSPVVDENGVVMGFMDTVIETTERVRFERGAAIRNRELVHRMKNSYALVSAVVNQTARVSVSKDELRKKLIERLNAMGQAQEILSLRKQGHASVHEIVQHAVDKFEQHPTLRFHITGPAVSLTDDETFAFTLALFELSTNSTKYGALSAETGKILVDWSFDPEAEGDAFRFVWRETGGPPVVAPKTKGFGTFLIRQALAAEFDGEVKLDYAPQGLVCTLRSPDFRRETDAR